MIPYQDLTFADYQWYWGESIMFTKRDGQWIPVNPMFFDEEGRLMYDESSRLEDIAEYGNLLYFTPLNGAGSISARPMEIFESSDWVTYEPRLGYFKVDGRLIYLTSGVPRSRHKGLTVQRLRARSPLDGTIVPRAVEQAILIPNTYGLPIYSIADTLADRMTNPWCESWYALVIEALLGDEPTILDSETCVVPDRGKGLGHLLHNGTLLGHIRLEGTRLLFTERTKPTTSLEEVVHAHIRSKLIEVPTEGVQLL
jgi:hypothetical protein